MKKGAPYSSHKSKNALDSPAYDANKSSNPLSTIRSNKKKK